MNVLRHLGEFIIFNTNKSETINLLLDGSQVDIIWISLFDSFPSRTERCLGFFSKLKKKKK